MAAHLAQLRLTRFKSFADPATLDLLPGLTGLVNPNGCGKSNLAEALRWAMGWRAGWASSFAASLELTKQGQVTLAQDWAFAPVLVHAAPEPGTNNPCAGHPGRQQAVPAPQR